MTSPIVRLSMAAYLAFAVPHTLFHMLHLDHLTSGGVAGLAITLGVTVVVPVIVLPLDGRQQARVPV
jgi:hypothetical protein